MSEQISHYLLDNCFSVKRFYIFMLIFSEIRKIFFKGFSFVEIFFLKKKTVQFSSYTLPSKIYFGFLKIKRLSFIFNKKVLLENFNQKKGSMKIRLFFEFINHCKKKKKIPALEKFSIWVYLKEGKVEFFKKFYQENICFKKNRKIDLFNYNYFFKTKKKISFRDFSFLSFFIFIQKSFRNLSQCKRKKCTRYNIKEYTDISFGEKPKVKPKKFYRGFQGKMQFCRSLFLLERGRHSFEDKFFDYFKNFFLNKKNPTKKRNILGKKPKIKKKKGEISFEFYYKISNFIYEKEEDVKFLKKNFNRKRKDLFCFISKVYRKLSKTGRRNIFPFEKISGKELLIHLKFFFNLAKAVRPISNQQLKETFKKKNNEIIKIFLDTQKFSLIYPSLIKRKINFLNSKNFKILNSIGNDTPVNFSRAFFRKIKKSTEEIGFLFFKILEVDFKPLGCFFFILKFEKFFHFSKIYGNWAFKISNLKKKFLLENSAFNFFTFWNILDGDPKGNCSFPGNFLKGPANYYFLEFFLLKSSQKIVFRGFSGFFFGIQTFLKFPPPLKFCALNFLISKIFSSIGYTGKGRVIWIQGIFFLNRLSKNFRFLFWKFLFFFEFLTGSNISKKKTKIIHSSFNFLNKHSFFLNSFYYKGIGKTINLKVLKTKFEKKYKTIYKFFCYSETFKIYELENFTKRNN